MRSARHRMPPASINRFTLILLRSKLLRNCNRRSRSEASSHCGPGTRPAMVKARVPTHGQRTLPHLYPVEHVHNKLRVVEVADFFVALVVDHGHGLQAHAFHGRFGGEQKAVVEVVEEFQRAVNLGLLLLVFQQQAQVMVANLHFLRQRLVAHLRQKREQRQLVGCLARDWATGSDAGQREGTSNSAWFQAMICFPRTSCTTGAPGPGVGTQRKAAQK